MDATEPLGQGTHGTPNVSGGYERQNNLYSHYGDSSNEPLETIEEETSDDESDIEVVANELTDLQPPLDAAGQSGQGYLYSDDQEFEESKTSEQDLASNHGSEAIDELYEQQLEYAEAHEGAAVGIVYEQEHGAEEVDVALTNMVQQDEDYASQYSQQDEMDESDVETDVDDVDHQRSLLEPSHELQTMHAMMSAREETQARHTSASIAVDDFTQPHEQPAQVSNIPIITQQHVPAGNAASLSHAPRNAQHRAGPHHALKASATHVPVPAHTQKQTAHKLPTTQDRSSVNVPQDHQPAYSMLYQLAKECQQGEARMNARLARLTDHAEKLQIQNQDLVHKLEVSESRHKDSQAVHEALQAVVDKFNASTQMISALRVSIGEKVGMISDESHTRMIEDMRGILTANSSRCSSSELRREIAALRALVHDSKSEQLSELAGEVRQLLQHARKPSQPSIDRKTLEDSNNTLVSAIEQKLVDHASQLERQWQSSLTARDRESSLKDDMSRLQAYLHEAKQRRVSDEYDKITAQDQHARELSEHEKLQAVLQDNIAHLKIDIARLQAKTSTEQLESDKATLLEALGTLQSDFDKKCEQFTALEVALTTARQESDKRADDAEQLNLSIAELKRQLEQGQQDLCKRITSDHASLEHERIRLRTEHAQRIASINSEHQAKLSNAYKATDAAKHTLELQLQAVRKEYANQADQIKALTAMNVGLEQRPTDQTTDGKIHDHLKHTKELLEASEQAHLNAQADIAKLQIQVAALLQTEEELDSKCNELDRQHQELLLLRQERVQLQLDRDDLQTRFTAAEESYAMQLKTKADEAISLHKTVTGLQHAEHGAQDHLAELQRSFDKVQQQINEAHSAHEHKTEELAKFKADTARLWIAEKEEHTLQITQLQTTLDELKAEFDENLHQQTSLLAAAELRTAALQAEADKHAAEGHNDKRKIQELNDRINEAAEKTRGLETELAEALFIHEGGDSDFADSQDHTMLTQPGIQSALQDAASFLSQPSAATTAIQIADSIPQGTPTVDPRKMQFQQDSFDYLGLPGQYVNSLSFSHHKHAALANTSSKLISKTADLCSSPASAARVPPATPTDKTISGTIQTREPKRVWKKAGEQQASSDPASDEALAFKIVHGTPVQKHQRSAAPRVGHTGRSQSLKQASGHGSKPKKRKYDDRFDEELVHNPKRR